MLYADRLHKFQIYYTFITAYYDYLVFILVSCCIHICTSVWCVFICINKICSLAIFCGFYMVLKKWHDLVGLNLTCKATHKPQPGLTQMCRLLQYSWTSVKDQIQYLQHWHDSSQTAEAREIQLPFLPAPQLSFFIITVNNNWAFLNQHGIFKHWVLGLSS